MDENISRRDMLTASGAVVVGVATGTPRVHADKGQQTKARSRWRYCLNTSTIRGQKKSLEDEIRIAAKAGYDGIEPWVREIDDYVRRGGNLADLRKRITDSGLIVESAIAFARWIVDDETERSKGLETAKRDMELVRKIGGNRIAAPPVGATRQNNLDLLQAAARYRELLKLGQQVGVTPQLEVWGFSRSLSRLGEAMFVAVESGHAKACLLPDVYHIYKGGSDFAGLNLIDGGAIHVFHMNDYPSSPSRDKIGDADRVYPGDGVAPLNNILQSLSKTGFRGTLSLELFNRDYWKQDALEVARTGLRKMKAAVATAMK